MVVDDDMADVFAIPDFWQQSSWLTRDPKDHGGAYFFFLDLDDIDARGSLEPITVEHDGFFKKPEIDPPQPEAPSMIEEEPMTEESEADYVHSDDGDSMVELWLADEELANPVQYRTWDLFNVADAPPTQPLCVTEAGRAVYDAIIMWPMDPLGFGNKDHKVVDTKTYFSSLLALAAGRESLLFSWDAKSRSFRSTIPQMRISGYSAEVLRGIQDLSLRCGCMSRRLSKLVESTYARHPSRCRVALASALGIILAVMQTSVAVDGPILRSLIQLQSLIRRISAILSHFDSLAKLVRPSHSDEDILLTVFRQAQAAEYSEPYLRDIMRVVLQRVSRPWVDFMEEWIGTRSEQGIGLTKEDVGATKCFIKVEPETYVDDFGQEVDEVDFRLDRSKMPDFIPEDIATSVFETGKNLRFIRTSHPDHPLAHQETISDSKPPQADWLYDWDSIMHLEQRVAEYQTTLLEALSSARDENNLVQSSGMKTSLHAAGYELQVFGAGEAQIENNLLASMQQLSRPLIQGDKDDHLAEIIRRRVSDEPDLPPDFGAEFTPHWSLLPGLSFGPIVAAHGRIVNRESLRLLFKTHDLRAHLRLQREFQLFGNGMFCSRLSHALFDPDLETAERQAGVARQGGIMGLRLSGRDNWPPASSELRLALMGVLAESYESEGVKHDGKMKADGFPELPGDLSFAVRDMLPEDVDKCMDQDSLEALDFLRLSYKPPPALASILTPTILIQYDRVFKLMLRVLRLGYIANQLFRDLNMRTSRWAFPDDTAVRFSFEAHRFVESLSSYFVDMGISMPWKAFEDWLDKLQYELESGSIDSPTAAIHSPERLRACHSIILDRIMFALLLRKRQQPVLKLLEEIFGTILQFAKRSQTPSGADSPEVGDLYKLFRKKVEVFITVCKGLSEKGDYGLKTEAKDVMEDVKDSLGGKLEENTIGQLLMKLDMFNYYVKGQL